MDSRVHQYNPESRHGLHRGQFFPDTLGERCFLEDEERNVGAELHADFHQAFVGKLQAEQVVNPHEHGGGIAASPSQSGRNGNPLVDGDVDSDGLA